MSNNLLAKFFLKIFDKNKYNSFKYNEKLKKIKNIYDRDIKHKIIEIDEVLKSKKEINFL